MNEITDAFEKSMATGSIQICIVALVILTLFYLIPKLPFVALETEDNIDSKIMDFLIAIPSILFSLYIANEFLIFKKLPEIGDTIFAVSQIFAIFLSIIIMEILSYMLQLNLSSSERSQSRLSASIHIGVLFAFLHQTISMNTIVGYSLMLLGRFLFYDTTFDLTKIKDGLKWIISQTIFFVGLSAYTGYLVVSILKNDYSLPGLIGLNIAIAVCFWVVRKLFREYLW